MLCVERVVNEPISSCCYVIYDSEINSRCIIIDPGSENNDNLYEVIDSRYLLPEYIVLTHEHFDHCWGVNDLRNRFPKAKLICSIECSEAIQKEKRNCSVFYDNTKAFVVKPADIITQDIGEALVWNKHTIRFVPTPGHSFSSISIMIDNNIFTGDALIPGVKTVVKLPTGSAILQKETEKFFQTLKNYHFYPGHGEPF